MAERNDHYGSGCSHCEHCQTDSFVASRLDIWKAANAALRSEKWMAPAGEDEEGSQHPGIEPADVFMLARFLSGDND